MDGTGTIDDGGRVGTSNAVGVDFLHFFVEVTGFGSTLPFRDEGQTRVTGLKSIHQEKQKGPRLNFTYY